MHLSLVLLCNKWKKTTNKQEGNKSPGDFGVDAPCMYGTYLW